MYFTRFLKATVREVTPGRLAAAKRAVTRDAASVPLFPELRRLTTAEARLAQIDRESREMVQRWRNFRAASWRRARLLLRLMPHTFSSGIKAKWSMRYCPGDASYLLDMIWCASRDAEKQAQYAAANSEALRKLQMTNSQ